MSSSATTRTPLPEGTVPVAAALLIGGVATYAFFKVGTWAVGGADEFTPISSLWFATFALAPGFFLPLEQELGRALAHRRAVGEGGRPVVSKVFRLSLVLVAVVVIAILAVSPFLASNYFDGDWVMVVALIVAFVAYAPAHLARGVCSGSGRFRQYAVVMGTDGVVRIVLCVTLALLGIQAVGPYGFAVGLAPLVGVGYVYSRGSLRTDPGPDATWSEVTPNLGWLLLGSVFAASLLNAGPIATTLLAEPDQDAQVTQFAYGVLLARIPLFMFQAVQAALLPRLSRLAATGEFGEFLGGLRRLMIVVAAVGVVGTLGALTVGPFGIELVYGAELTGRYAGDAGAGERAVHGGAGAGPRRHRPQGSRPRGARLGRGCRRLPPRHVVVQRRSVPARRDRPAAVVAGRRCAFAVALRHRLAVGARPDAESMMEAMTDMPLES